MNKLFIIIFYGILIEVCLGGDGRIFSYGFLSARQILFILAVLISIAYLSFHLKDYNVSNVDYIVFSYIAVCFVSVLVGTVSNHDLNLVVADFKSRLSIILYIFFYICFKQNLVKINDAKKVLIYCGCLVSVIIFNLTALIWSGFVSRTELLTLVLNFDENSILWIRANGAVFYPSLFFSLVAFVILLFDSIVVKRPALSFFSLICVSIGLYASLTKGLILGHLMALGIWIFARKGMELSKLMLTISLLSLMIIIAMNDFWLQSVVDRITDKGNGIRILSTIEALESWAVQPVFGTGFGQELALKARSLENSWLDYLMEQGLVGFVIILVAVIMLIKSNFDTGLSVAVVIMSLVTMTNPFFTNSLGLTFVALCLGWLKVYNEIK